MDGHSGVVRCFLDLAESVLPPLVPSKNTFIHFDIRMGADQPRARSATPTVHRSPSSREPSAVRTDGAPAGPAGAEGKIQMSALLSLANDVMTTRAQYGSSGARHTHGEDKMRLTEAIFYVAELAGVSFSQNAAVCRAWRSAAATVCRSCFRRGCEHARACNRKGKCRFCHCFSTPDANLPPRHRHGRKGKGKTRAARPPWLR